MAILMGAVMAIIMMVLMGKMYDDQRKNIGIYAGTVAVFALSLWLVRSQTTVGGVSRMRAMIPHHSIAILTSERAHIKDPRVRELADGIIKTQRKEIAENESTDQRLRGEAIDGASYYLVYRAFYLCFRDTPYCHNNARQKKRQLSGMR